jgi:hypothetical protein
VERQLAPRSPVPILNSKNLQKIAKRLFSQADHAVVDPAHGVAVLARLAECTMSLRIESLIACGSCAVSFKVGMRVRLALVGKP